MKLVIVESPTKGKTIEKFLDNNYRVLASFGHIRDLPEGRLGVDPAHDFAPDYRLIPRAKQTISALTHAVADAEMVYLATDHDREGEAIAWHLMQVLGLGDTSTKKKGSPKPVQRITFHEITKDAIRAALDQPRAIDEDLVNAQQARRILDRLVGYKLSPFLWKKVMKGLSAGRVQSVTVRLIVDREREIEAFKPVEYWTLEVDLQKSQKGDKFTAQLVAHNGDKLDKLSIGTEVQAKEFTRKLEQAKYVVSDVRLAEQRKWASAPFTTSTLQQEASRRLSFSAKKTMKIAQDLYEAGQITYMRTDSTNLAEIAVRATRGLIEKDYGREYLPQAAKHYQTKAKGAQEAHEAIRPTEVLDTPDTIVVASTDHQKLYELIWRRMVACQMEPAVLATIAVTITATTGGDRYEFAANGSTIKFDGYLKVWPTKLEERTLPNLEVNEAVDLVMLRPDQHFTEPPPRYNEASLIKTLEENGIGRPTTYAPTMSTIIDRGYVRLEGRVFYPQEIGLVVTDLLKEHFPNIVDVDFTAKMEDDLDQVAEGKSDWVATLKQFYGPFEQQLVEKLESVQKQQLVTETTDEVCEKCRKPMQVKLGRFGKFLACTGFPDCRNAKPLTVSTGVACPICGEGELVERKTRRGKTFWSCNRYPDCKAATWDLAKPAALPDPNRVSRWQKKSSNEKVKTQKSKVQRKTKK